MGYPMRSILLKAGTPFAINYLQSNATFQLTEHTKQHLL